MASIASFILDLFGVRTITQNFIPVADEPNLEFDPAFFTVTNDDANQRNIVTGAGSAPSFGVVTASSVIVGPETWTSQPPITTTAGETVNLLSPALAIPASGTLRILAIVEVKVLSYASTWDATWTVMTKWARNGTGAPTIKGGTVDVFQSLILNTPPFATIGSGPDPTNQIPVASVTDNGSGVIRVTVNGRFAALVSGCSGTVAGVGGVTAANGTWGLIVGLGASTTTFDLVGSTFSGLYTSGGTITIGGSIGQAVAVGNAAQIQAAGILPPPWVTGETVPIGAVRYSSASGNTYIYTSSGTTSAHPTGTTTGSDSGLTYEFVATGQRCPGSWRVTDLRYAST